MEYRVYVNLECGLVYNGRDFRRHVLETERARALKQHSLVLQLCQYIRLQQIACRSIETLFGNVEEIGVRRNLRSYADETLHRLVFQKFGHRHVQRDSVLAALEYV